VRFSIPAAYVDIQLLNYLGAVVHVPASQAETAIDDLLSSVAL